ncbi:hypothetical protein CTI12_AA088340 [Artemisia annua]|uniref:Inactive purple acid phosphatase-like protein n=1 Tax=Artemisia annua TaxID=35608 RepID=A0A2U1Q1B4_ARTAN|nr:hypothetical protein CTI12_AA088340 [Artemisia annua]
MASQLNLTFTHFYTKHKRFLLVCPNNDIITSTKLLRLNPVHVSNVDNKGGTDDSYLGMWRKAMDRERKEIEFNKIAKNVVNEENEEEEDLEKKSSEFFKILEVPKETRDEVQRMQLIDRAAAAIAVVSNLKNEGVRVSVENEEAYSGLSNDGDGVVFYSSEGSGGIGTPGPNFWSWVPPSDTYSNAEDGADPALSRNAATSPVEPNPVMELDPSSSYLSLPFETKHNPPLPPLQSLMEVEKQDVSGSILETPELKEEHQVDNVFSTNAEDAIHALADVDQVSAQGTKPEGSMWWKETGTEVRPDGVVCRWTLTRGVSADKSVEWEDKYWEASDEFGYKELGSEKSGRDAFGNVWREFWKESMSQVEGCLHIEKTADKWGKNGQGDEWQEKWFEHYGAGQAEKWAHKWCSTDPSTQLEAGHAHVWHERWGEKYDGQGGSVKYTDKWAERAEGDGWTKWGDKWDEHFDPNGHGVKQGETWWEGKYGERWNKTWGEGHNGSGWVHKYGKSSSGEHWDTHVQQDTWYERYPHYGFYHCFENSVPLRQVKKPSERDLS